MVLLRTVADGTDRSLQTLGSLAVIGDLADPENQDELGSSDTRRPAAAA